MYPAQATQAEYELMLFYFLAKLLLFSKFIASVRAPLHIFFEIAWIIPTTIYCAERMYSPLTELNQCAFASAS